MSFLNLVGRFSVCNEMRTYEINPAYLRGSLRLPYTVLTKDVGMTEEKIELKLSSIKFLFFLFLWF